MDLGQCPKLHSQKLKDDYESAVADAIQTLSLNGSAPDDGKPPLYSVKELEGLKREYERNIMSFVDECDRRIRAAQRRLEKTPEENNKTTALMREIGEVETAYQLAMQAVEQLGKRHTTHNCHCFNLQFADMLVAALQVNPDKLTNPWPNWQKPKP